MNLSTQFRWLYRACASIAIIGLIATGFGCETPDTHSPTSTQPSISQQGANRGQSGLHVDWSTQPAHVRAAINAQEEHAASLMNIENVIGTGVEDEEDGTASILVFARKSDVNGIPSTIKGHKTKIEVVGDVTAMAGYRGTYRPVPCGVSIGNDKECASGTLGCVVQIGDLRYALSNNHVLAMSNAGIVGDRIDQPGRYDAGCGHPDQFATLADFCAISFVSNNVIDAAIAKYTAPYSIAMVDNLYTPSVNVVPPTVGLAVKKVGRTTGLTSGKINGVNVTIRVQYDAGVATFVNQIYVRGRFLQSGDSGSLMVSSKGNNPVGLCFAGSSNSAFANPIGAVLSYFGATIVGI